MDSKVMAGRVAAITGAGNGLGRAYAQWLARNGCAVVVNNRTHPGVASSAQRLVDEIRAEGGQALAHHGTVDDPEAAAGIVALAIAEFGKLDVLICNAGIMPEGPFAEMKHDEITRVVNINLLGSIYPLQRAWRHMLERGYGRVVLAGSTVGTYGFANTAVYGASRAAAIGLARSLTAEKPQDADIGVNVILPFAYTQMSADAMDRTMSPEVASQFAPDKIAPTVGWLCSDSCMLSGQLFHASALRVTRVGIVESAPVSVDPNDVAQLSQAEFGLAPVFEPVDSSEAVTRLLTGSTSTEVDGA